MDLTYNKLGSKQLAIIYELAKLLTRAGDEEFVLDSILSRLIKETGAEVGAFVYYDSDTDSFIPKTIKTQKKNQPKSIQFSQTVFRKVLKNREAVLSFDIQSEQEYRHTESVKVSNIHSVLAFPLIVEEGVYGIIYFDSRENRQNFNETARQLVSFFTPIASLTLEQLLRKKQIENENILLKNQVDQSIQLPTIIGKSQPMIRLSHLIRRVAKTDVPILITGENGTGKDLVAKAIHELSNRKDKSFIAQYIGNIPSTILESELFGYKKGAFTGANRDRIGLFEALQGGTLFLDEIGDLQPELQTKFLRVLQNAEIKRLGENIIRKTDVRIIAATNKDLARMVKAEQFRQDLYYRLNVINIKVPALRERKTDIPLLTAYFLNKETEFKTIKVSKSAMKKLIFYNWPGNVRQLENTIKRASIMANGVRIEAEDIQFDELSEQFSGTMEEFSNKLIIERLKEFNYNKSQAAKSLGISLRSLQMKAKKLGI